MRLDTAEKRAAYRAVMIPKDSTKDARSSEAGEVYCYQFANGKLAAMAFRGSAGHPEWHYSYRNAEQREAKIAEFFASIAHHQEFKAKNRADAAQARYDVQVGDIFRASWGYDQTNIDYYEVTALIGSHLMEVREICQQAQETGFMQGDCVPTPGHYATEPDGSDAGQAYKAEHGCYPRIQKQPRRVKIQGNNGEPCFRVASYCHAYRIKPTVQAGNVKVFAPSRWTAYA